MVDCINFTEEEFLKLTLEEIEAFGNDINKIKVDYKTLIFYLIKINKIEIIKNLINELDLNVESLGSRNRPLHWSCIDNNFEITTLLLEKINKSEEKFSKINVKKNFYDETPLYEACHNNNFKIVKLLIDTMKDSKEFIHEININSFFGMNPLYQACKHKNYEMVTLLLENGVIPYVNEEGNYECLKGVCDNEHKEKLQDFIFKFQSQNIKKVK